MAEDKSINELTKIKGLSKKQAVKLYRAGIKSIKKLGSSNPEELAKLTGIAKKQLTTWVILARAQERKKFIEVDAAAEEISQLVEIKIDEAKKLVGAGVMSIDDLADESADLLSEDTGMDVDTINKWIKKAKEVKKLPIERRKVVVMPSAEVSFGSKLSGAFLGSSSGFSNIYNDSSSFKQSLIFVLITSIFFCLYLSVSTNSTLLSWWQMTATLIPPVVFDLLGRSITLYPLVFIGGIAVVLVVWLLFGKVVASSKHLEFKNTSAVLGFAMAPGILFFVVVFGKFLPVIKGQMRTGLLPLLLIIFSLWVVIVFFKGVAFSPRGQTSEGLAAETMPATPASTLEVVEEEAAEGLPPAKPISLAPAARAPPAPVPAARAPSAPVPAARAPSAPVPAARAPSATPPARAPSAAAPTRVGPLNLSEFGTMIDAESLAALQKAGFVSSLDLLRANSKDIADKTGIQQSKIIIWRILADLLRIAGLSIENALILTKSGVRSVKHLAKINENALRVQVLDTISKENISTSITAQMLSDWINKSKAL